MMPRQGICGDALEFDECSVHEYAVGAMVWRNGIVRRDSNALCTHMSRSSVAIVA